MRFLRVFLGLLMVVIVASAAGYSVEAQNGDSRYFPETGYTVRGDFLRYYDSIPDPLLIAGYPISNEMEVRGKRVQYFTRARFEISLTESNAKVTLGNLGKLLHEEDKIVPAGVPTNSPTCRHFPKTGYSVCYMFLSFYDANHGSTYFGEPIANAEIRDGRTVQYFENARLEWRPNMPTDQQIGVSDLGTIALAKYVGEAPKPVSAIINTPPAEKVVIHVQAWVSQALVPSNTPNTLFVVVQDQLRRPVKDARVTVALLFPDGKRDYRNDVTNEDGVAKITVPGVSLRPKEIVKIEAKVEFNNQTVTANTWYRIWY